MSRSIKKKLKWENYKKIQFNRFDLMLIPTSQLNSSDSTSIWSVKSKFSITHLTQI